MISALVFQTLKGLVHNRVYPNTFEQPSGQPPRWPAIRYTVIASEPTPDICGTVGVNLDDVRVQLDIVAQTYGAAVVLRDQVIAAMALVTTVPMMRQSSGFETYDDETKTHRIVIEYVFYPSSALTGSPP